MSNFRYYFTNTEEILTQEEHEYCLDQFKKGRNTIALRDGTMGINMALVKHWRKTDRMTEEQERKRDQQLALQSPTHTYGERGGGNWKQGACEYRTKMGWPHPEYCECKKSKTITT